MCPLRGQSLESRLAAQPGVERAVEMPRLETTIFIRASRERCFDLSRDLDLHQASMADSGERAIAGRTSGLIELGEEVTWEARHFGVLHQHRSKITAFNRPEHFRDVMVRGRFKAFEHDHFFGEAEGGTLMRDVLVFASPLGPLGRLVDKVIMSAYLERLIAQRNQVIKVAAESPQ